MSNHFIPDDPDTLSRVLLTMMERDQKMRIDGPPDPHLDIEHTRYMKEVVGKHGWPTRTLVGARASFAAWILVQHADHDVEFQRKCLGLIEALPESEVRKQDVAFLTDRVRVNSGKPQLYGSQFGTDEKGQYGPKPIENIEHLDERRLSVGLQPFEEYRQMMFKLNKKE